MSGAHSSGSDTGSARTFDEVIFGESRDASETPKSESDTPRNETSSPEEQTQRAKPSRRAMREAAESESQTETEEAASSRKSRRSRIDDFKLMLGASLATVALTALFWLLAGGGKFNFLHVWLGAVVLLIAMLVYVRTKEGGDLLAQVLIVLGAAAAFGLPMLFREWFYTAPDPQTGQVLSGSYAFFRSEIEGMGDVGGLGSVLNIPQYTILPVALMLLGLASSKLAVSEPSYAVKLPLIKRPVPFVMVVAMVVLLTLSSWWFGGVAGFSADNIPDLRGILRI